MQTQDLPSELNQTIEQISQADEIIIISHARPDGDAYGSALGLALSLKTLDKHVAVWNQDGMNQIYQFLPGSELITRPPEIFQSKALVIAVDTSSQDRLGPLFNSLNLAVDINIDHHASTTRFGKINRVRPDLPATAAVIMELIEKAGWPMTPEVASNLYVGLSTDTGSFCYSGTTADTFERALRLIRYGADPVDLARKCYQSIRLERFELMRLAFQKVRFECQGKLACLELEPSLFKQSGAEPQESEGLVERLQQIESVQISALFETLPDDTLKVSLRSKWIPIHKFAESFGGGGHPLAAGIKLDKAERKSEILKGLCALLGS